VRKRVGSIFRFLMPKTISLKLDEPTYLTAEKIRKRLKVTRNAYFRKAISYYNALCFRKLLEREYRKASARLAASHLKYLKETELLEDFLDEVSEAGGVKDR
jgi:hypothetical protein